MTPRGAENLMALAELSAAVRWLHPSDQVIETEWEPLLLDGVRGLEAAASGIELVEGLRGLLVGVAPTVVIWRSAQEQEELVEPDAKGKPASEDHAKPANDRTQHERSGPPSRNAAGAPSDRKKEKDAAETSNEEETGDETASDETAGDETAGDETAGDETSGDDETSSEDETSASAEPEQPPPSEPEPEPKPPPPPSEPEPRPPLPAALFEEGSDLEITQWHRQGFSEGLDDQPGCAQRIHRQTDSCSTPSRKRKREQVPACSRCEGESYHALAPGAPAEIELPRGLSSAMPVALWTRGGRTLPASPALAPAPAFDERRAWDYDLADRGARLLSVIRAHSLLRGFHAHREVVQDQRELLRTAMSAVAEDDSPLVLHEALERMLASFGDGNGEVQVEFGKPARRWTPELTLRWIGERVVIGVTLSELARAGDVITKIDGVAIDELLARELGRTPAARPGAAIERTVARLLARRDKGATIELDALRTGTNDEQTVALSTTASYSTERPVIEDARPSKAIVELREGLWYVDATRVHRLDAIARRLRRADGVIVDLRGQLADPRGSLSAHLTDTPLAIAHERMLAGPDEHGALSLASVGDLSIDARRPRFSGRIVALADSRTRGPAELELLGFERLGVTIVGSASAGDLGAVSQAWLPGGWRLSFTTSEVRRHDGSGVWGQGVRPSVAVDETLASVRAGEDVVLRVAQSQFDAPK